MLRREFIALLLASGFLVAAPDVSRAKDGDSGGSGGNSGSGSDNSGSGSDNSGSGSGSDNDSDNDNDNDGGNDNDNDNDNDDDDDDSSGSGSGSQSEARRALKEKKVVPLRDIIRAVRRKYPGDVLDARLRKAKGGFVYRLKILDAKGQVRRVTVDALTTRILEARSAQ